MFKTKSVGIVEREDELKRHYTYVSSVISKKNRFGDRYEVKSGLSVTHHVQDGTVWIRNLDAWDHDTVAFKSKDQVEKLRDVLNLILENWK